MLRVERDKGGNARCVPCDEVALPLHAYRIAFGLPPVPLPDADLPLLLTVRRSHWVISGHPQPHGDLETGDGTLHRGARTRPPTAGASMPTGLNARPRWFRHTYAKGLAQAVRNGLGASAALENMGHDDLRSFHQYVTTNR